MKSKIITFIKEHFTQTANIIALVTVLVVYFGFTKISILGTEQSKLSDDLKVIREGMDQRINNLEEEISKARGENALLLEVINDKSAGLEEALGEISDTVGTLEKLSETDKELLQKYSKVYFLNEHFLPENLSNIGKEYLSDPTKPLKIHSGVQPYLEEMLGEAMDTGVEIKVLSGYRSFYEQTTLKSNYKITYGSGANQFSADQGYSEHQLGTTVDLTSPENGLTLTGFQNTEAYSWLLKHAWEYGFTLSYPENNAYYEYEPWHWRFVGESLAGRLHRDGIHFYDMDQREIDKYLVKIFD